MKDEQIETILIELREKFTSRSAASKTGWWWKPGFKDFEIEANPQVVTEWLRQKLIELADPIKK